MDGYGAGAHHTLGPLRANFVYLPNTEEDKKQTRKKKRKEGDGR